MKIAVYGALVNAVVVFIGWHNIKGAVIVGLAIFAFTYLLGSAVCQEWLKWKDDLKK